MDQEAPQQGEPLSGEMRVEYRKSNFFRVIRADGVHGGLGPNGRVIHLGFFTERRPIPDAEIYNVKEGVIGDRVRVEVTDAIVIREMETSLLLDLDTAISVHKWLGEKIKQASVKQNEFDGGKK